MADILWENGPILKGAVFVTMIVWICFSTILYYTERNNPDEEMRENYGSLFGGWDRDSLAPVPDSFGVL